MKKILTFLKKNAVTLVIILIVMAISISITTEKPPTTNPQINSPASTITPTSQVTPTIALSPNIIEQGKLQAAIDFEISAYTSKVINDMPFLTKLPIITDRFLLIYDFEKKSIRARLKTGFTQKDVESEVKTTLERIKVPSSIKVYYLNPLP